MALGIIKLYNFGQVAIILCVSGVDQGITMAHFLPTELQLEQISV